MSNPTFLLMLQCCPLDAQAALELTQIICDIEKEKRHDVEFLIAYRWDTNPAIIKAIFETARSKFATALTIGGRRYGTGHPGGCNDLWQDSMMQVSGLVKNGLSKAGAVLTFEPDCVPLRHDWIEELMTAWMTAPVDTRVVGSRCQMGMPHEHINGNAIFHPNIMYIHPELALSQGNWDVFHRKLLLRIGAHTNSIEQLYAHRDPVSREFIEEIRSKYRQPALLHGVKDGSARAVIREMISDGSIYAPIKPKARVTKSMQEGEIKFSISILAMNNLALTEKCIDSVLANSTQPFELMLWDNGSTDGTTEYFDALREAHPNVIFTPISKNIGFIQPNNQHAASARGRYFICLNNDATVPPGWLELLEEPFVIHENCAITGPMGTCNELNAHFHGGPGKTTEYIEGSCLCVRMDLVKKHGLFSEYLHFAYGEDCDLSLRMRALGYTIHQVPFRITHQRSSTGSQIPNIQEIQQRNHDTLQRKWGHYLKVRHMNYPIIVRRAEAIGDVLLTTPIIRALKAKNPQSLIYVHTKFPELFEGNQNVEAANSSFNELVRPIPSGSQVIDLDMAYENRPGMNIVDAYHEAAGTEPSGHEYLQIFVKNEDVNFSFEAQQLDDPKNRKRIALHASPTTWNGKNWPAERWNELAGLLRKNYRVILVGRGDESIPVQCDLNLVNKTTIHQMAAVLAGCDFFVGHDSFPFHCACATAIPAFGLFGITDSKLIIPKGTTGIGIDADPSHPFKGARHKQGGTTFVQCDDSPMNTITVDQVMAAIEEKMA